MSSGGLFRDLIEVIAFDFPFAVRLHGGMNPRFFQGTIVEDAVAATLAEGID